MVRVAGRCTCTRPRAASSHRARSILAAASLSGSARARNQSIGGGHTARGYPLSTARARAASRSLAWPPIARRAAPCVTWQMHGTAWPCAATDKEDELWPLARHSAAPKQNTGPPRRLPFGSPIAHVDQAPRAVSSTFPTRSSRVPANWCLPSHLRAV